MKRILKTRDKKLKLCISLLIEVTKLHREKYGIFGGEDLHSVEKGDYAISLSTLYGRYKWEGIGKIIKKGDKNGDGWIVQSFNGNRIRWNNEMFIKFPSIIQDFMNRA